MNIKSMRLRSYRSFAVDEHVPPEAAERYQTLKAYERLRAARCNEAVALQQLGMSRRTRYRWQAALAAGGQRGLAPKSTRPRRVRQRAWKSTVAASSWPGSRMPARNCMCGCTSCRPGGPNGTAVWSGQTARRGSSSGASTTVR